LGGRGKGVGGGCGIGDDVVLGEGGVEERRTRRGHEESSGEGFSIGYGVPDHHLTGRITVVGKQSVNATSMTYIMVRYTLKMIVTGLITRSATQC
jgi:hypothetical protein